MSPIRVSTNSDTSRRQNDCEHDSSKLVDLIMEDEKKISVERSLLVNYSSFFRNLFRSGCLESSSKEIRIRMIKSRDLEDVLKIQKQLIEAHTPDITYKKAVDLIVPASYLEFVSVSNFITEVVSKQVNPKTSAIVPVFRMARYHNAELAKRIWNLMLREFNVLYHNKEYLKLKEEELIGLLTDKKLSISNHDEINVVGQYVQYHGQAKTERLRDFTAPNFMRKPMPDAVRYPVIRNRVPSEVILSLGGWAPFGVTTVIEVYNTRTQKWSICNLSDEPEAPRSYNGVGLARDKIALIGGFDGMHHFQTTRIFDLNKRKWSDGPNMHSRRCYLTCATLHDSHGSPFIYACGGYSGHERLSTVEAFDVDRNRWIKCSSMSRGRSDGAVFTLHDRIMAVGGFDGQDMHYSGEFYDPGSERWIQFSRGMRTRRTGCAGIGFTEHVALVIGGFNGDRRMNSSELYDLREGIWHPMPLMLTGRSNFGVEIMGNQVYVAGGFDGESTSKESERFDARTRRWQALTDISEPKSALKLLRIADHEILDSIIQYDGDEIIKPWENEH